MPIMGPYIRTTILLAIPIWVFVIPVLILALVCVRFRRRTKIRNACAAIGLLISLAALPFVVVQMSFQMEADKCLEWRFGAGIDSSTVAKFRFVPGFLDTEEYWKLKNVDPNELTQIISKHNLMRSEPDRLFPPGSMNSSPWWWPNSLQGYSIFQGQDREGGSKELWIPKEGSSVYLYCFLE